MADYTIENIYQGGYSSFSSPQKFSEAGALGMTTDPRTANIIKDASSKIASGAKHMELVLVSPQVIDAIPKQQLAEARRLGELTGVEFSVHGPVIDTTGVDQKSGFSELNREASERRIIDTLERSHEISPTGKIPVVFHSGEGIPGSDWKTLGDDRQAQKLIVINRESGQMIPIEESKMYYPERNQLKPDITEEQIKKVQEGELNKSALYNEIPLIDKRGRIVGQTMSPEEGLISHNYTSWDNELSQLRFNKEQADAILTKNRFQIEHLIPELESGEINPNALTPTQREAYSHYSNAKFYLENLNRSIKAKFSKAVEFGNDDQRKILDAFSEEYSKNSKNSKNIFDQAQSMQSVLDILSSPKITPELYVPIEEFAVEQSSKTFGNAALAAYKMYGNESPLVTIENPPAGFGLSTAKDLKDLVVASRNHFVEKAVEEGISKKEATKQAEKLIAATWDLGHINMLRGKGFKEEDIIKETETIAPFVNHVHLSDNFGMEHTELPMGMGNVPMKEMMEKLGQKGFEAKKIIEAGNWWQHFQSSPFQETLEEMGSTIYSTGSGPYWSQAQGLHQNYAGGFGNMLPQTHYGLFGAGFSQLPTELGGSVGATGGRMSGRGME